MKQISLSVGKAFALVDDEDYEWLNDLKPWRITNHGYAQLYKYDGGKKKWTRTMAALIMQPAKGETVDHVNGDRLDNRRTNLRLCSRMHNLQNRKKTTRVCSSQYKGVTRNYGSWQVTIGYENKNLYIGTFKDEHIAALAYDLWADMLHGEYASLNFTKAI